MALVNTRELRKMYDGLGSRPCVKRLRESLKVGHLKPRDFTLRDLAEGLVTDRQGNPMGPDYIRALDPMRAGDGDTREILEAVDSSAFANITGQLAWSTILEAYENTMFVGDQMMTTIPTRLNGEKIPGVTNLGDDGQIVEEGKPYPRAGVSQDWVETPQTTKRGLIVEVTKEAIFFDTTGIFLGRCAQVGEALGLGKEKRILDMVLGVTNNYKWRGTAYDTYQTSSPWDNVTASCGLTDWTDIDEVLTTFADLTDPATGEPILMMPNTIWLHTSKRATLNYILNSTQVKIDPNANAGTSQYQQYVPNNVLVGQYQVIASPMMDARYTAGSVTTTDWFMGDPKRAFSYMENWPITVVQMPPNSYEEWNRDVVAGWKASERGTVAVTEPRRVGKATA